MQQYFTVGLRIVPQNSTEDRGTMLIPVLAVWAWCTMWSHGLSPCNTLTVYWRSLLVSFNRDMQHVNSILKLWLHMLTMQLFGHWAESTMATHLSTLECESPAQFIHDWSFTGVVECCLYCNCMCFDLPVSVLSKRVHNYHICTCEVCWF